MSYSSVVQEFIEESQSIYACYILAVGGFKERALRMAPYLEKNSDELIHISDRPPNVVPPTATLRLEELLNCLGKDARFSDVTAKSLLVYLFTRWDEFYRPAIAKCVGKETKHIQCNLMGELRIIRNIIVHEKSMISQTDVEKITCIPWSLQPGLLNISEQMMQLFTERMSALEEDIRIS